MKEMLPITTFPSVEKLLQNITKGNSDVMNMLIDMDEQLKNMMGMFEILKTLNILKLKASKILDLLEQCKKSKNTVERDYSTLVDTEECYYKFYDIMHMVNDYSDVGVVYARKIFPYIVKKELYNEEIPSELIKEYWILSKNKRV